MTRRGGPYPHLRLDLGTKVEQGMKVTRLYAEGHSFRAIAELTGWSTATCWRRYWWLNDFTLPGYYGRPHGPVPPQRGTRACPNGRPYLPTLDGGRR